MIWLTADTHFSHTRIIDLAGRPFRDAEDMNDALVANWNAVVAPDDTVYHLGDVALGKLDESLPVIDRCNGRKVLIIGNHDRIFRDNKPAYIERFWPIYAQHFTSMHDELVLRALQVRLAHLPYDGDSHDEDRYVEHRPADDGMPLLCGHVHEAWKTKLSKQGTPMLNVGVDAQGFFPINLGEALDALSRI